MAPLPLSRDISSTDILHIRHVSDSLSSLRVRDATPPTSFFTTLNKSPNLASRSLEALGALSKPLSKAVKLVRRQQILAIPTTYAGLNAGPAPGTVVGIVIGSVGGFLLILWLIYTCFNLGGYGGRAVVEEEVIRRRSRSPRRSRSRSEVIEVRRSRSPPRTRRETVVVEERRTSAPVVEREDDIVEVIEEHDPPRRVKSKRQSGFRTVDPAQFAGGGRPLRKVRR